MVAENRTLGVVVLKVGFAALEAAWTHAEEKLAVTSRGGLVFITNVEEWRYHRLPHSPPITQPDGPEAVIQEIGPLPWIPRKAPDRVGLPEQGKPRDHLLLSAAVPGDGWTIHMLTSARPAQESARQAGLLAAAMLALAALAAYALVQRRRQLAERITFQERARRELEQRVAQTTTELREAENELTQAAKLAALGQMSASIAHEINQPLAAIRSFADNAVVLLERERHEAVRENLAEIAELTGRMAAITRQLKGFARRASGTLGPVPLQATIDKALALMGAPLRRESVTVQTDLPEEPVWVLAEDVRLQQVLVNLIGNAVDAMQASPRRLLRLAATTDEAGWIRLSVRDSGSGLSHPDQLFVPFFTTKEAEGGLGLGLSISLGIVEDFGGRLTAADAPDGGAVFTLHLKRMEPPAMPASLGQNL